MPTCLRRIKMSIYQRLGATLLSASLSALSKMFQGQSQLRFREEFSV